VVRGISRRIRLFIVASLAVGSISCASSSQPAGPSPSTGLSGAPIVVGASVSLSGDFSSDGPDAKRGYELWAEYVNSHGGLLGRPIKLVLADDASNPQQAITTYQKLATIDKVDLLFGPYSTFLTKAVSVVAERNGYTFFTGMAGGPFIVQQGLKNVINIELNGQYLMDIFTKQASSLTPAPKTAAYITLDNPFTKPTVDQARTVLESQGIKTLVYKVYPAETTDFAPIASAVVAANPDLVVTGSSLRDLVAFVQTFKQQRFNPKALIAAGGADAGEFSSAVGVANTEGIMIPGVWDPSLKTPLNSFFVAEYTKKYGGQPSATAAEAFATGQFAAAVVEKNGSLDQQKLADTSYAETIQSILGPIKVDRATAQNVAGGALLRQWQNGKLTVVAPSSLATAKLVYPKPAWAGQ
jgi:branched-chain amino acid transport system substrate-binding protein